MKRALPLLIAALLVASSALSFDTTRRRGNRIAVLDAPAYDNGSYEDRVSVRVRDQLVRELRSRGFDARDARMTYDELRRDGRGDADLYVELARADAYERPVGDVGVRVPNATIDVAVVVSRVAAELRVYDGRTLDLIARRRLDRATTTVVPTGVGAGTVRTSVFFALPFVEHRRYRTAVNAVVEDAANEVVGLRR